MQCSQEILKGATAGCDCTKRALTVEHMATNICKNVSPINRLAAKSSCNWWLRGRGHHYLRVYKCYPLALTSLCFLFFLLSPSLLSIPFWAHLTEHILRTQSWTTGKQPHEQCSAIRTQKFIFYSFCGCHHWPYALEQSECSLFPRISGGGAALWFIKGIKPLWPCCDVTRHTCFRYRNIVPSGTCTIPFFWCL